MSSAHAKPGMKLRAVAWAIASNLLMVVSLSAAVEIHVAPAPLGDDAHPGTVASPVATLQAAQKQVREISPKDSRIRLRSFLRKASIKSTRRLNWVQRIPAPGSF